MRCSPIISILAWVALPWWHHQMDQATPDYLPSRSWWKITVNSVHIQVTRRVHRSGWSAFTHSHLLASDDTVIFNDDVCRDKLDEFNARRENPQAPGLQWGEKTPVFALRADNSSRIGGKEVGFKWNTELELICTFIREKKNKETLFSTFPFLGSSSREDRGRGWWEAGWLGGWVDGWVEERGKMKQREKSKLHRWRRFENCSDIQLEVGCVVFIWQICGEASMTRIFSSKGCRDFVSLRLYTQASYFQFIIFFCLQKAWISF